MMDRFYGFVWCGVANLSREYMPALNKQKLTLVDVLLQKRAISKQSYHLIKREQANTGKKQEEIIRQRNLVLEKDLLAAKSELYNIPLIDVRNIGVNPQALSMIPQSVAKRFLSFPYDYKPAERKLFVVMADPLNISNIDFLERKSQCRIMPAYGIAHDIEILIQERYAQGLSTDVDKALQETRKYQDKGVVDEKSISNVIREAPIAKIVMTILSFAMRSLASDVHIEPLEDKTRIRYRLDGILHEKLVLPKIGRAHV